ncbi:MAG: 3-phosphoshikimate 1-carboxyvinyltransferase, partial [bacterium]|nr:3-phosphoshikimate 1-carboxyvinyltransferase [bacterium]
MKQTRTIRPARLDGSISAPASKSDMLRAVAAAYLTGQDVEIRHPSFCDDGNAALNVVKALGAQLDISAEKVRVTPGAPVRNPVLDCGESGLLIRMFPAIASLRDDEVTLTGHGSLLPRPISMIEEPLTELGVRCCTKDGFLPVTLRGPLQAGAVEIDGSVTSQFLTGLLMALPLCEGNSEVIVKNLKSRAYVEMTLNVLKKFDIAIENQNFERFLIKGSQQYRSQRYDVEGDWSGASFPLAAGAISGHVRVENLDPQSLQADKAMLEVLHLCCVEYQIGETFVDVRGRKLSG